MPLKELKEKSRNTVRSFERRYETHVFFYPEDEIPSVLLEVRLVDDYHNMNLFLLMNMTNTMILDIDVEETRVPFETCPNAVAAYHALVGKELVRVVKQEGRYVEKRLGCLHINELLEEGFRAYTAAYGFFLKDKYYPLEFHEDKMFVGDLPREKRRHITQHWWMKDRRVKNSCYSFSTEREQSELKEIVKDVPSFTDMTIMELKKQKK
jgi:hypothetical protein